MSDNLRSKVIRLAHTKPELRPHLLPLLALAGPAQGRQAYQSVRLSVASLPNVLRNAILALGFKSRIVTAYAVSNYTVYAAGDDGNRGFFQMVSLAPPKAGTVLFGAFGGGGLGAVPSPVDTDNSSKSLADGQVVLKGQKGGAPYLALYLTAATLASIHDPMLKAAGDAEDPEADKMAGPMHDVRDKANPNQLRTKLDAPRDPYARALSQGQFRSKIVTPDKRQQMRDKFKD